MLIIGSHVSFGNNQLLGSVEEAISYGANALMFYTGAPSNTLRKPILPEYLSAAQKLMQEQQIDLANVICHAPYIINLANRSDDEKWQFSINFLQQELTRCEELGVQTIVLHPGSAVGITKEEGLQNIAAALQIILAKPRNVTIALETMAGKGSECGTSISEIAYLLNSVPDNTHLGVCLDTCHLNDAGYDMADFDIYLDDFAQQIPLSKIKCIHINDSKNPLGSHKDRHANIGFGTIGFANLIKIIYHEKLKDVPKILETPYIGQTDEDKERLYPPYKYEIAMIKQKEFNPHIMEDIRSFYK